MATPWDLYLTTLLGKRDKLTVALGSFMLGRHKFFATHLEKLILTDTDSLGNFIAHLSNEFSFDKSRQKDVSI